MAGGKLAEEGWSAGEGSGRCSPSCLLKFGGNLSHFMHSATQCPSRVAFHLIPIRTGHGSIGALRVHEILCSLGQTFRESGFGSS